MKKNNLLLKLLIGLSALTGLVVCLLVAGAFAFGIRSAQDATPHIEFGVEKANQNPRLRELIGNPIEIDKVVGGTGLELSPKKRHTWVGSATVHGPKGLGVVGVSMSRPPGEEWRYRSVNLTSLEDDREEILELDAPSQVPILHPARPFMKFDYR